VTVIQSDSSKVALGKVQGEWGELGRGQDFISPCWGKKRTGKTIAISGLLTKAEKKGGAWALKQFPRPCSHGDVLPGGK